MKFRVDVLELLAELKIETHRSGIERRGHCPNPAHANTPGTSANLRRGPGSWQIVLSGPRAGQHVCYSCGFGGGPVALVAAVLELDLESAKTWLLKRYRPDVARVAHPLRWKGKDSKLLLRFPPGCAPVHHARTPSAILARDFLIGRAVTDLEIEAFGMLACSSGRYHDRVIVPVVVHGELVDFVARLFVDGDEDTAKALSGRRVDGALKELALFNFDGLDPRLSTVYVVEGVWGALALMRSGFTNVVAACGSAWSDERTSLLRPWERIVLVPDGDEAGSKLEEQAAGLRHDHHLFVVDLPKGEQPDTLHPTILVDRLAFPRRARFKSSLSRVVIRSWSGKAS